MPPQSQQSSDTKALLRFGVGDMSLFSWESDRNNVDLHIGPANIAMGGYVLEAVRNLTSPVNKDIEHLLKHESTKIAIEPYSLRKAIQKTRQLGYDVDSLWTNSARCAAEMEHDLAKFRRRYSRRTEGVLDETHICIPAMSTQLCTDLYNDLIAIEEEVTRLQAAELSEIVDANHFIIDTSSHAPGCEYHACFEDTGYQSLVQFQSFQDVWERRRTDSRETGETMMIRRQEVRLSSFSSSSDRETSHTGDARLNDNAKKRAFLHYTNIRDRTAQNFARFKQAQKKYTARRSSKLGKENERDKQSNKSSSLATAQQKNTGQVTVLIGPFDRDNDELFKSLVDMGFSGFRHTLMNAYGCLASHLDLIQKIDDRLRGKMWNVMKHLYTTITKQTDDGHVSVLSISLKKGEIATFELVVPKDIPEQVKYVIVLSVLCRHPKLVHKNALSRWLNTTSKLAEEANGSLTEVEILFLARNGGVVNAKEYTALFSNERLVSTEGMQSQEQVVDEIDDNEELESALLWAYHFANYRSFRRGAVTRVIVAAGMIAIYDCTKRELGLVNVSKLIDIGKEVRSIQRYQSRQVTLRDVLRFRLLVSVLYNGRANPKSSELLRVVNPTTIGLAKVKYTDVLNFCWETLGLHPKECCGFVMASFEAARRMMWKAGRGEFNGVLEKMIKMQVDEKAERKIVMDCSFAYYGAVGMVGDVMHVKDVDGAYKKVLDSEEPLSFNRRQDGMAYNIGNDRFVSKVAREEMTYLNLAG